MLLARAPWTRCHAGRISQIGETTIACGAEPAAVPVGLHVDLLRPSRRRRCKKAALSIPGRRPRASCCVRIELPLPTLQSGA